MNDDRVSSDGAPAERLTDEDRELLLVALALQTGFISPSEFVELTSRLAAPDQPRVEDLVLERGFLTRPQLAALEMLLHQRPSGRRPDSAPEGGESPAIPRDATVRLELRPQPDRYRLGRELGRGGLGRVVSAIDADLMGREVAMKLLLPVASSHLGATASTPPEAADPGASARRRFLGEARITGRLWHPNIVPVFEVGRRPDDQLYYTMPVIRGRTLQRLIDQAHEDLEAGSLSDARWGLLRMAMMDAFRGLCHALAFAHSRGVIHRDVKPSNVMVGDFGEVVVVDWGLAKVIRPNLETADVRPDDADRSANDSELEKTSRLYRESNLTREGMVTGTPSFMSPEQGAGRIKEIDERSDVYSLGSVLFTILVGRPPFTGGNAFEIVAQILSAEEPPDPRLQTQLWKVPEDLAAICMKAMAFEKSARYPSAQELLDAVNEAIEGTKERERSRQRAEETLGVAREKVAEYHRRLEELAAARSRRAESRVAEHIPFDDSGGEKRRQLGLDLEIEGLEQRCRNLFNEALAGFAEALGFDPSHRDARRELGEFHFFHMVRAERTGDRETFDFHRSQAEIHDDGGLRLRLEGTGMLALTLEPPATVTLHRYREDGWFLKPQPLPIPVPSDGEGVELAMGSYLLTLRSPGFEEARVPFEVGRGEVVVLKPRLRTPEQIGDDMVYVPRGKFWFGEGPGLREVMVEDFCIGRFPVTFREYCLYLDWLAEHDPDQLPARRPLERTGTSMVSRSSDGRHYVVVGAPGGDDEGEPLPPEFPVFGVSWHNANDYCRWLSERLGREFRLPDEFEWEKAARGTDGRRFPWGNRSDATLCKSVHARPGESQPEPVGAFPTDTSPYGVRDMAGGVCEWTATLFDERNIWRAVKGGAWTDPISYSRVAKRGGEDPRRHDTNLGFRFVTAPLD